MGTVADAPHRRMLSLLLMLTAGACSSGDAPQFDVILRGGTLQAAGEEPEFVTDVAFSGDRIAAMGNLAGYDARDILDVTGLHVAPGFIDTHSHAGSGLDTEERSTASPCWPRESRPWW